MKNLFKTMVLGLTLISVILSGCGREVSNAATEAASPDRADPVIQFEAQKTAADGTAEYYLFDDNPEHLSTQNFWRTARSQAPLPTSASCSREYTRFSATTTEAIPLT